MSVVEATSAGVRDMAKDMAGQQFGLLTIVRRVENIGKKAAWECVCKCGRSLIAAGTSIRSGSYVSCGCTRKATLSRIKRVHGASRSTNAALRRLYVSWCGMNARCSNPKHKDFKYYGAIGISVCQRWKLFQNFYADMGDRPEGLTLDRRDCLAGYSPENCRWATNAEQRANQRRNQHVCS